MMALVRHALAVVFLALFVGQVQADTFTLTDGRVLFGTVVRSDDSTLWIDTAVAGIRATIPVARNRIDKHEKNNLTAEHALRPRNEPEQSRHESAKKTANSFAVIPLAGEVGEDIFAKPIEDSLVALHRNKVHTAVLLIDTPGGYLHEGVEIAKVLARYSDRIRIVAVVQKAISAGIWPTFASHEVYVLPDGVMGGAVIYSEDSSTGSLEVDAKLNSIAAAQLGAIAELRGHSPDVVQAMIVLEAELHAFRDKDGITRLSPKPPVEVSEFETIDTGSTVLTLRALDADRFGVASFLGGGLESLPGRLGLEHNARASEHVKAIHFQYLSQRNREKADVERTQMYRRELITAIPALVDALNAAVHEASLLNPDRYTYPVDQFTGRFTREARRRWQSRTDNALRAWYRVGEIGVSLRNAINDAERLEVSTSGLNEIDAKWFIDLANRRIAELRSNRGRDR